MFRQCKVVWAATTGGGKFILTSDFKSRMFTFLEQEHSRTINPHGGALPEFPSWKNAFVQNCKKSSSSSLAKASAQIPRPAASNPFHGFCDTLATTLPSYVEQQLSGKKKGSKNTPGDKNSSDSLQAMLRKSTVVDVPNEGKFAYSPSVDNDLLPSEQMGLRLATSHLGFDCPADLWLKAIPALRGGTMPKKPPAVATDPPSTSSIKKWAKKVELFTANQEGLWHYLQLAAAQTRKPQSTKPRIDLAHVVRLMFTAAPNPQELADEEERMALQRMMKESQMESDDERSLSGKRGKQKRAAAATLVAEPLSTAWYLPENIDGRLLTSRVVYLNISNAESYLRVLYKKKLWISGRKREQQEGSEALYREFLSSPLKAQDQWRAAGLMVIPVYQGMLTAEPFSAQNSTRGDRAAMALRSRFAAQPDGGDDEREEAAPLSLDVTKRLLHPVPASASSRTTSSLLPTRITEEKELDSLTPEQMFLQANGMDISPEKAAEEKFGGAKAPSEFGDSFVNKLLTAPKFEGPGEFDAEITKMLLETKKKPSVIEGEELDAGLVDQLLHCTTTASVSDEDNDAKKDIPTTAPVSTKREAEDDESPQLSLVEQKLQMLRKQIADLENTEDENKNTKNTAADTETATPLANVPTIVYGYNSFLLEEGQEQQEQVATTTLTPSKYYSSGDYGSSNSDSRPSADQAEAPALGAVVDDDESAGGGGGNEIVEVGDALGTDGLDLDTLLKSFVGPSSYAAGGPSSSTADADASTLADLQELRRQLQELKDHHHQQQTNSSFKEKQQAGSDQKEVSPKGISARLDKLEQEGDSLSPLDAELSALKADVEQLKDGDVVIRVKFNSIVAAAAAAAEGKKGGGGGRGGPQQGGAATEDGGMNF